MPAADGDLGFDWRAYRSGELAISRHGRVVSRMRGSAADKAVLQLEALDHSGQQQLLARLTGNYRRGNERPVTS